MSHLKLADWPPRTPDIEAAISESIRSGDWGRYFSNAHAELTRRLASLVNRKFVRLCSSGTAAVEMSLRAAAVKPGDEVIVCAFDYPGNVRCIEAVGATPVLVDAGEDGFSPTPRQIAQAAGPSVRAVIVSHLYGQLAEVAEIQNLCTERKWTLIEDACQSPGARIDPIAEIQGPTNSNLPAGSFGHLAVMSFGGSKPLTAGNGGAVLTDDPRFDARLKSLYDRPSDTFPLSALQAAVLLPQLDRLPLLNNRRCATTQWLTQFCQQRLPHWTPLSEVPHRDTVRCETRCFYKFAFLSRSPAHRQQIIAHANRLLVPLGEGFRSLHRLSDKRCRKPKPLVRSELLSNRLFVLDHQALMIEPHDYPALGAALSQVHDASCESS